MAVSLNSVVGFNSTLQAGYQHVSRYSAKASTSKPTQCPSYSHVFCSSRRYLKERRWIVSSSVSGSDQRVADTDDKGIGDGIGSDRGDSQTPNSQRDNSRSKTSEASNGTTIPLESQQEPASSSDLQPKTKRASLTARERLRAARALSRYNETTKASKPGMGSKILDVLKESDRKAKKKPGLPEAPTNLFDDSKRGLPKQGLTFQFPGGNDILIIAFSVVFISTVMFATTYIVWKAGAIHFNEY